jgi:Mg2+ and Co2+ transporter CorA
MKTTLKVLSVTAFIALFVSAAWKTAPCNQPDAIAKDQILRYKSLIESCEQELDKLEKWQLESREISTVMELEEKIVVIRREVEDLRQIAAGLMVQDLLKKTQIQSEN